MACGRLVRRIAPAVLAVAALVATTLVSAPATAAPGPCSAEVIAAGGGRLPDLRTVVPQHLNLVNAHQREVLRVSNLVANTGAGPWRMRPEFPLDTTDPTARQKAFQQVLDSEDSSGAVVCEEAVSEFEYHPTHRHWHTAGVARFDLRVGAPDGPVYVNDRQEAISFKTTVCLIDWVKLLGNANSGKNSTRTYFDCFGAFHGLSVGWADQYHHALDDQDLDITGVEEGVEYFLVSTVNPDGVFLESDTTNNTAWQAFRVSRHSNGNPKLVLTANSPCEPGTGLCGEQTANR